MKLYVKCGTASRLLLAKTKAEGAKRCIHDWRAKGIKLGKSVRVSEVGFGHESPHHEYDESYCVDVLMRSD